MRFLRFHAETAVGEPQSAEAAHAPKVFNLTTVFDKVISIGTVVLPFFLPLFFLPTTSEFFEFNKQALLIFSAIVLTACWFGKMWLGREVRFVRTPFDLPILLFLLAYLVATLTSINMTVSVLGHFGRFNGGLVSVVSYVLLYFVYVNNVRTLDQIKRIAWSVSLSATLLSIYGVLQYFGIYAISWWEPAKSRFFNPLGSPNVLAYYLMAALPISLSLLAVSSKTWLRAVTILGAVASFAYIALINVLGAWLGVGLALAAFVYFAREATFGRNRKIFTGILVIFLALSLGSFLGRDQLPSEFRDIPKEINLDWGSSWQIAASTLRDKPLVGSGPDTFLFDFTRFRDVSLNATPYWNLRFDRASNELLQVLTTLGLLGLAAFLFFIYRIGKFVLSYLPREKELETHTISVGFAGSLLSLLLLGLFFSYFSTVTAFTLWLSLAMLVRLWVEEKQVVVKSTVVSVGADAEGKRDIMPAILLVPALTLAAFFLFIFGRMYLAEAYFQKSLEAARANDGINTYDFQRMAIETAQINLSAWQIRLDRDIYHTTFSDTNLLLANTLAGQENRDESRVQLLVSQSINEARTATALNPWNVNNWEQAAKVFRGLLSYAQGSDKLAEDSYKSAITLDPASARLYDALGTFYTQVKRYEDAVNTLVGAVRLKPDLAAARFDLAKAWIEYADVAGTTKEKQRDYLTAAKTELENTLKLVATGSSDEKEVKTELDKVNAKLATLGGPVPSTSTPTVPPTATPSGTRR